ncbi:MAG TPA: 3D domain-containing protein [Bryobacteraceae bacterium]|nr:3D domain-containing protein [Bryobacteraceae bacterium]
MGRLAPLLVACLVFAGCGQRAETADRTAPQTLRMKATAYSQEKRPTASGARVREGLVATDPDIVPLGSRIRITGTDGYDGVYTVADTGRRIKGHEVDIYLASDVEAKKFGEQRVTVEILDLGEGKADARQKAAETR